MSEAVQSMNADLKTMGATVKVGYESAARQDELAALDEFIRSPLTSVPDKIEGIDSLIFRNLQWGLGRTDQFWDYVYIAWKRLYKNWLTRLSLAETYGSTKVWVEYSEAKLAVDGKVSEPVPVYKALEPSTVVYMLLHPKVYVSLKVIREEKAVVQVPRFGSPNIDVQQLKRSVYSYGYEHVLQMGMIALNYIYHPAHVNVNTVLVLAGAMQNPQYNVNPTGGNPAKPSGPREPGIQNT